MLGNIEVGLILFIVILDISTQMKCPSSCECSQTAITCRKANLKAVPRFHVDPKGEIKLLSLEYNNITKISRDSLASLPGLEVIHLKSNEIFSFDKNTFCSLKKLKLLNLDENQIGALPEDTFQGCSNLEVLSLNGNFICNFSKIGAALSQLKNLRELGLNANVMDNICGSEYPSHPMLPKGISALKHLTHLNLSDNMYKHLQRKHLKHLAHVPVKSLDLSRTFLIDVDNDTFLDLHLLENLDLSYQMGGVFWIKKAFHSLSNSSLRVLKLRKVFDSDSDAKFSHNHLKPLRHLKLEVLDLGESFGAWPKHLPGRFFRDLPHLKELYLDGSELFYIVPGAFDGLTNLKRLHLQNNMISCGGTNTFLFVSSPLQNLEYLDLNNNVIMTNLAMFQVSKHSFPNLQTLLLRNNRISSLTTDTFTTNTLKMLDLSENPLTVLPNGAFSPLSSLKKLKLENLYKLQEIQANSFEGLVNLQELNMNRNNLKIIHQNAFAHLANLTKLQLGDSSIFSSVHVDFMRDFDSLRLHYLDISGNRLENVPSFIKKQHNLQHLDMSYNRIHNFTQDHVPNNSKIRFINISYNEIVKITSDTIKSLKYSEIVDISGNPFYCFCETYYRNILKNINLVNHDRTICRAPTENAGISILNFTPSKWTCSIKPIIIPILSLCLFIAFVIFIFIIVRKCQKVRHNNNDHYALESMELGDRNGLISRMRCDDASDNTQLILHKEHTV